MGYLVAVDDLRSVTLDQVHYMSLWATGQNDDTIVSRAAGNAFSVYLAQSTDQKNLSMGTRRQSFNLSARLLVKMAWWQR